MQRFHLYSGIFLVAAAAIYGVLSEPVNSKCSLAKELFSNGVSKDELGDWLCIGLFASNYSGIFEVPDPADDGTKYYGVFQISNEWWCKSPHRESHNLCNVSCEQIVGDDFSKTLECAQAIKKHNSGFRAWKQWNESCQNEENKPNFDECFS